MTTILWLIATLLALATVPLLVISHITESDRERARRWRREGLSQARIATRMGCSRHRVRRLLAA